MLAPDLSCAVDDPPHCVSKLPRPTLAGRWNAHAWLKSGAIRLWMVPTAIRAEIFALPHAVSKNTPASQLTQHLLILDSGSWLLPSTARKLVPAKYLLVSKGGFVENLHLHMQ